MKVFASGRRRWLTFALLTFHGTAACGDPMPWQNVPMQQRIDRLVAKCRAIPADRYWTGLIFNPKDLQTGYERSRCFQDLAVHLRDRQWCPLARERTSWFFDGSGISPTVCRHKVDTQVQKDISSARRIRRPQQVTRLQLWRNGNGKDIDVHVWTSGGSGRGLWLTLSLIGVDGRQRILARQPQPMGDEATELTLFVPMHDMQRAFDGQPPDQAVTIQATLQRLIDDIDTMAIHRHAARIPLSSSARTRAVLSTLERKPSEPVR